MLIGEFSLNKILTLSLIFYPFALILFEKFYFSSPLLTKRDIWVGVLFGLTKFSDWLLKAYIVLLLVNFVAPFEIFSFSNMPVPKTLNIILSFLFIDFISYALHWLFHRIPFFWRIHRLHHSDEEVDTITTLFHHPLERVADIFLNIIIFVLFDVPVPVILLYGFISALIAPLSHIKILFPKKLNTVISYFIVTQNFHRVHHSLDLKEGNSNFGIVFSWWDKLFRTYTYKTNEQLDKIKFGINFKETPSKNSIKEYLINPFIHRQEKY